MAYTINIVLNRMQPPLDILAFAAHPDDVEISAGGTLYKSTSMGQRVGIIDLTQGELGSRGSAALRREEAANASRVLGITARENLCLRDGFFTHDEDSLRAVIMMIRKYRPQVVLCNSPTDRHPDHGRAAKLVAEACYYSGLTKIETHEAEEKQHPWRPKAVYQYIQDYFLKPHFVIDVSECWQKKIEALKCYGSQFFDPYTTEPATPISGEDFFDFLKGRALTMGRPAGYHLAEGFITLRYAGVPHLLAMQ